MGGNGEEALRKGSWKAEEDEVLLNHVRRYGSRDWMGQQASSQFEESSAEEERVVIELQAQFGNKWAKIATYLAGITDNDVKNFWSSRPKRLARALQNSATFSKSHKHKKQHSTFHEVFSYGGPKLSTSSSSKASLSSDNHFLSSLTDCVQTEPNHVERKPHHDCLFPKSHNPNKPIRTMIT